MEVIKDSVSNYNQLAIVEKYETNFVSYLMKRVRNIPNEYSVERAMVKQCLHGQVRLFNIAGKSNQIGKLYDADAGMSDLRYWLRFMVKPEVKALTPNQFDQSLIRLAEVGGMLNKWISGHGGRRGQHG
jgi:hypothetical protein